MAGFEDLQVWQEGRLLAVEVYRISGAAQFRRDWSLKDQMRRAAVSIPSNIAEGHQRKYRRDFARFLTIALGSCGELRTQVHIATDLNYVASGDSIRILDVCARLSARIQSLREAVLRQADGQGDTRSGG